MIHCSFAISNPWATRFDAIKVFCCAVTTNKSLEIGLYKTTAIIGASVDITVGKRDHKGFRFGIDLLGYMVDINFYDNRHYDEIIQNS